MNGLSEYDSVMKRKDCFATTITGFLGCLWRRKDYEVNNSKCDTLWFSILLVISLFAGFLLYYWIIAGNSADDFSWFFFKSSGKWIPLQFIILMLTAVLCGYLLLLFLLSMCHFGCGYRVYISISHRVLMVVLLCGAIAVLGYMADMWPAGWQLQALSLMITGPFLHIAFVTIMTFCSWIIIESIFMDLFRQKKVLAVVGLIVFSLAMLGLYLVPLAIQSPCICEASELPPKPKMFAHRGASAIAPENTVLSFEKAGQFAETFGFESDVLVSYDGVPFLMHDTTLRRTTDIGEKFPGRELELAATFNMSEIKSLNAGAWFLKQNPFGTVSSLSVQERDDIQNNIKVPTLEEYLDLAVKYNKSVLFDLTSADYDDGISADHPYVDTYQDVVIQTVLKHNISQDKVFWLYVGVLNSSVDNNFTRMYGKEDTNTYILQQSHIQINVPFNRASLNEVRSFHNKGIAVNVWVVNSKWLYSLYWCMGVDTVTTNFVHSYSQLKSPVWHLTPTQFLAMWLGTDAISICLIVIVIFIQRKRHISESASHELVPLDDRDIKYTGL